MADRKNLLFLDVAERRVHEWDGLTQTWAVRTATPLANLQAQAGEPSTCLYVHRGDWKVLTRWTNAHIYSWDGAAWVQEASVGGAYVRNSVGPPVMQQGWSWFANFDKTTTQPGSPFNFIRVQGSTLQQVNFAAKDYTWDQDPTYNNALKLIPYLDGLVVVPHIAAIANHFAPGDVVWFTELPFLQPDFSVDPPTSGQVVNLWTRNPLYDVRQQTWDFSDDIQDAWGPDEQADPLLTQLGGPYEYARQFTANAEVYQGSLHVLNVLNQVLVHDYENNTWSEAFPHADAAEFAVGGGPYTVDAPAASGFLSGAATMRPVGGSDLTTTDPWRGFLLGKRVEFLDGPQAGEVGWVCSYDGHAGAENIAVFDDTGTLIGPVADGNTVSLHHGLGAFTAPITPGDNPPLVSPLSHMCIWNDGGTEKLVIAQIIQRVDPATFNAGMYTQLIVTIWDGVSVTRHTSTLPDDELYWSYAHFALDQTEGLLHFMFTQFQHPTNSARQTQWVHAYMDLSAGTTTTIGVVPNIPTSVPIGDAELRTSFSCLACLNEGDVHVEQAAPAYDSGNNRTTVTYTLYSTNSESCDVEIEWYGRNPVTNEEFGWVVAPRDGVLGEGKTALTSSPAGVTHTFVHDTDAATPGGYPAGGENLKPAYRVRVVSQTRT